MTIKKEVFLQDFLKKDLPDIRPGDTIKVYQKIKEGGKERVQIFEGQVIARKHGKGLGATITVRKVISGVGVERIFPLHSPVIQKIEVLRRAKVRRAKLYYLRHAKGKKARLKKKESVKPSAQKETKEENLKTKPEEELRSEEVVEKKVKE